MKTTNIRIEISPSLNEFVKRIQKKYTRIYKRVPSKANILMYYFHLGLETVQKNGNNELLQGDTVQNLLEFEQNKLKIPSKIAVELLEQIDEDRIIIKERYQSLSDYNKSLNKKEEELKIIGDQIRKSVKKDNLVSREYELSKINNELIFLNSTLRDSAREILSGLTDIKGQMKQELKDVKHDINKTRITDWLPIVLEGLILFQQYNQNNKLSESQQSLFIEMKKFYDQLDDENKNAFDGLMRLMEKKGEQDCTD